MKKMKFFFLHSIAIAFASASHLRSLKLDVTMRPMRPFRDFINFNMRSRGRSIDSTSFRAVPECTKLKFQTLNGFCNNRFDSRLGAIDSAFEIIAKRQVFDFEALPNARMISNIVCNEEKQVRNGRKLAELFTFFGQLIDHTVTEISVDGSKPLNIDIPADDVVFNSTSQTIPFSRTVTVSSEEGDDVPLNLLSSFIDASSIYSVEEEVARQLREFKDGRLSTPNGLLIEDEDGFFISGDVRVNENPNLTALHLLWTLEHNQIATEVSHIYPDLDDEGIYQLSRRVLIAQFQYVVFYEFVPALIGTQLPEYRRYQPRTRPGISLTFSTVGFRVGHTLLNSTVTSISSDGITKNRMLRDSFFNPNAFREDGLDALMRGLLNGFAAEVDPGITTEVRNFLLNEGEPMQLDLAALNIQRGRDHGVPAYNDLRVAYGLPRFSRFEQINDKASVVANLKKAYNGDINIIDPWVGGISENPTRGSSLGELFQRIWIQEFVRLRNGDSFYFENINIFTRLQIANIPTLRKVFEARDTKGEKSILRDVIIRNTGLTLSDVSIHPFFAK